MQLSGFLKRAPAEEPDLRSNGTYLRHATRGCILGCAVAIFLWFVPIPVAAFVWMFDLRRPFVDYMLAAIPGFLSIPVVGAVISLVVRRYKNAG